MSSTPLITFKAGKCVSANRKVRPDPTPGYLYIYSEDDLLHLCWRPRSAPSTDPELDLLMIPGDGTFHPLVKNPGAEAVESPTNGRIFVLKFSSSSQKYYFWMQSAPQHKEGNHAWFSQRDQRIGQVVDALLQGEDVDVEEEERAIREAGGGEGNGGADGDADAMEVDQENGLTRQGSGGAGQDATGGDPREEGHSSREGGADGGRAPQDTNDLVQNFLRSIQSGPQSSSTTTRSPQQPADKPYTTLPDLLTPATTIPFIDSATPSQVDNLCAYLPPDLFLLHQASTTTPSSSDPNPTPAAAQAAIDALSSDQKKDILKKALRSPQFTQSLGSLTVALRDGGLPMIGEALGLKVRNGGVIRGGSLPVGGGEAVEAFVEGVRATVEEEGEGKGRGKK
ncbi:hypothetical protein LTS14_002074 [Recurvomyces mirabilis]|nr:hypothetical protein LTS14_002074 [Recurvomyces mirabilis]